jgi:hypothetical protein
MDISVVIKLKKADGATPRTYASVIGKGSASIGEEGALG